MKKEYILLKWNGLLLATVSIILFKELNTNWVSILFIPISIGYALWFNIKGFISFIKTIQKEKEE